MEWIQSGVTQNESLKTFFSSCQKQIKDSLFLLLRSTDPTEAIPGMIRNFTQPNIFHFDLWLEKTV